MRTRNLAGAALAMVLLTQSAWAGPYSGQQEREIKALSAEQVTGLLEGRGSGYALSAELNNYPGPLHVLELGEALGLDAAQRARTQRLYERMRAEAQRLGGALVAKERELDQLFATGDIAPDRLRELTEAIGLLQGQLRAVHLQAHLEQKALLSAHQVHRYAQLRGYHQDTHRDGHRLPDHHHH